MRIGSDDIPDRFVVPCDAHVRRAAPLVALDDVQQGRVEPLALRPTDTRRPALGAVHGFGAGVKST